MKNIFLIILLLMIFDSCARQEIDKGQVYSKRHDPRVESSSFIDDEDFIIFIRQWNNQNNKYDTDYFYAKNISIYNKIQIGDTIKFDSRHFTKYDCDSSKSQGNLDDELLYLLYMSTIMNIIND